MISSVRLSEDGNRLVILDQTLLPKLEEYIYTDTEEAIWEAIRSLRVRGAPAIGIAAAYGIYVLLRKKEGELTEEFIRLKSYLSTARPTAVNLFWALDRMEKRFLLSQGKQREDMLSALLDEANNIYAEDQQACLSIGENALALLKPGMGILTHCNAGGIATSGYGTALAPIILGNKKGYGFRVYADETRPLLQGARLTVWELMKENIAVTLICDSAAASVMNRGLVDAVIVGCDRVAKNGDSANKIGTLSAAIAAHEYGIPFYVCCPVSTIDPKLENGDGIEIEERSGEELYRLNFKQDMAPAGVKTYNPAFDVTGNRYISAIITEYGAIFPPYDKNIPALLDIVRFRR